MKKIIIMLLLGASASVMAQKTVVTPYGEKLAYPPPTTNVLSTNVNTITSNVNGVLVTAPAVNSVNSTLTGSTLSISVNGVVTSTPVNLSLTEPWKVQGGTSNASSNTQDIYQTGKVAIGGTTAASSRLFSVYGDGIFSTSLVVDGSGVGDGTAANGLRFGGPSFGEGISSNRTTAANGNLNGLDIYTNNVKRISIGGTSGNIGIGTTAPAAKLDVQGNIKIVDGTQKSGAVLTSDANGLASWQMTAASFIDGVIPSVEVDFVGGNGNNAIGGYIDLPAGNWMVNIGLLLNPKIGQPSTSPNSSYGLRVGLSSSDTVLSSSGYTYAGTSLILNTASIGTKTSFYALFAAGIIRVKTTAATTRLYLWNIGSVYGNTGTTEIGSIRPNAENYIFAIKTI